MDAGIQLTGKLKFRFPAILPPMKIGIIGAGCVGRAIGKLATGAGHQVMRSNSRGPHTPKIHLRICDRIYDN